MRLTNKNTIYRYTLAYILFFLSEFAFSQSISVTITGIRSDQGFLIVSLFENQEQFKSEQPVFLKKTSKEGLKDSTLIVKFNSLPSKAYGIAVLDDENDNGEMDYRLKRPTEGFGFSNYYHKGLFRPKFEDFSFEVGKKAVSIVVAMRYIKDLK